MCESGVYNYFIGLVFFQSLILFAGRGGGERTAGSGIRETKREGGAGSCNSQWNCRQTGAREEGTGRK